MRDVTNEREVQTNSMVQHVTIEQKGGIRLTGAYLSPKVSGARTEVLMKQLVLDGKGKDIIMGDLHARHQWWDIMKNARRRALIRGTV